VARFGGLFGRRIGQRRVTSATKRQRLDCVGMFEVNVFPSVMMQRLLPFGRDFCVAIAAQIILGQTNTRNRFEVSSWRWPGQRHIVRAARSRYEQKPAHEGDADARECEALAHGEQSA
jgi:hypothetical protein